MDSHPASDAARDQQSAPTPARPLFRQWVDDTRTISFRQWEDDTTEYAIRGSQASQWGEWQLLSEIKVREAGAT